MSKQDRLRVGIFFGGSSREREISFAGGRTVYDNIDQSLFEAVPIFVDSFNNFILIDWQNIYKGSIRDFFPSGLDKPFDHVYIESVCPSDHDPNYLEQVEAIGKLISISEIKEKIDFAFLCLHGTSGEDGSIQGLLEFYGISYSGSGIFPSAVGMDKSMLSTVLGEKNVANASMVIGEKEWNNHQKERLEAIGEVFHFPLVVRPANQGSSIGVSIVKEPQDLKAAVDAAFFQLEISEQFWTQSKEQEKISFASQLVDIRNSIGYPMLCEEQVIKHPNDLIHFLDGHHWKEEHVALKAAHTEHTVMIESFIEGREFSCIVVRDIAGNSVALPPTEIKKGTEVYDYRSKYLPGLSRKETPIDLPEKEILRIQEKARSLFDHIGFHVYARIDGFYSKDGSIILNDPNTTSGMLPSSFFFHQAAEVGWTPSGIISFIIGKSLQESSNRSLNKAHEYRSLSKQLERRISWSLESKDERKRLAVILGGFSSERHISLESGRNIFEKLNGSPKYKPEPIFLTEEDGEIALYQIPMRLLLKDNADDIKRSLGHESSSLVNDIRAILKPSIEKYQLDHLVDQTKPISFEELASSYDFAFIALHGRPGEDGALQKILEQYNLPFNGSPHSSAEITIDKFRTLQLLRKHGFKTAHQLVKTKEAYLLNKEEVISEIESEMNYPFVCKPIDDGCSSAVKIVKEKRVLSNYLDAIFRENEELELDLRGSLDLNHREEFPKKKAVLIEELITQQGADHFMEITGGLRTEWGRNGTYSYHIFAPSESIAQADILSIEEKFLAGEGMNITPPRYSSDPINQKTIDLKVREKLQEVAELTGIEGYARIDAFVRIFSPDEVELIVIEVNSLPGMTPATAIFHQTAYEGMKPYEFIDKIITFGLERHKRQYELEDN